MDFHKILLEFFCIKTILVSRIGILLATDVFGLAARKPSVSMLVVPARYTVIQVGNDIRAHRPSVMVSYNDMDMGELFVWDGSKWISITASDLAAANFVRRRPSRVVLVGNREDVRDLERAVDWCDDVVAIEDMRTTALLNQLGRIFNFSDDEWQWFASRYGCELNINNRDQLEGSWYDQTREEFLAKEAALEAAKEIDLPPSGRMDSKPMEEMEPIEDVPAADIEYEGMSGGEAMEETESEPDDLEVYFEEDEVPAPEQDIEIEDDADDVVGQ